MYRFSDGSLNLWSRQERRTWLIVFIIGTTALYCSRTAVPLLVPAISKQKRWSKADSGLVLSSFFWGYTATQVLGGYLSDKFGGQRVIFASALGWSCITLAMPLIISLSTPSQGLSAVIAARVAHGAFQGAHFPGLSSLASIRLASTDRTDFIAITASSVSLGVLFSGIFGSFILDWFNWETVFYVFGSLCFLWTIIFYRNMRSDRINSCELNYSIEESFVPWSIFFSRPAFWALTIAHACQTNCFFTLISWLPTYFHDNYPEAPGWLVNMVPWLFTVPFTILGKMLSEKVLRLGFSVTVARKICETACLLTQAIGLVILEKTTTLAGALACVVVTIGAAGFHNSAVIVNPGDLAPSHTGSVFGLMNTAGSVPGFLGVYAAGQLLNNKHSWSTVFQEIASLNIFGLVVYIIFGSGVPIVI